MSSLVVADQSDRLKFAAAFTAAGSSASPETVLTALSSTLAPSVGTPSAFAGQRAALERITKLCEATAAYELALQKWTSEATTTAARFPSDLIERFQRLVDKFVSTDSSAEGLRVRITISDLPALRAEYAEICELIGQAEVAKQRSARNTWKDWARKIRALPVVVASKRSAKEESDSFEALIEQGKAFDSAFRAASSSIPLARRTMQQLIPISAAEDAIFRIPVSATFLLDRDTGISDESFYRSIAPRFIPIPIWTPWTHSLILFYPLFLAPDARSFGHFLCCVNSRALLSVNKVDPQALAPARQFFNELREGIAQDIATKEKAIAANAVRHTLNTAAQISERFLASLEGLLFCYQRPEFWDSKRVARSTQERQAAIIGILAHEPLNQVYQAQQALIQNGLLKADAPSALDALEARFAQRADNLGISENVRQKLRDVDAEAAIAGVLKLYVQFFREQKLEQRTGEVVKHWPEIWTMTAAELEQHACELNSFFADVANGPAELRSNFALILSPAEFSPKRLKEVSQSRYRVAALNLTLSELGVLNWSPDELPGSIDWRKATERMQSVKSAFGGPLEESGLAKALMQSSSEWLTLDDITLAEYLERAPLAAMDLLTVTQPPSTTAVVAAILPGEALHSTLTQIEEREIRKVRTHYFFSGTPANSASLAVIREREFAITTVLGHVDGITPEKRGMLALQILRNNPEILFEISPAVFHRFGGDGTLASFIAHCRKVARSLDATRSKTETVEALGARFTQ